MSDIPQATTYVHVMIIDNNRVLLGLRSDEPELVGDVAYGSKGKWALPGGVVLRENPEEFAKRAVKEQTGLQVSSLEGGLISNENEPVPYFVTIGLIAHEGFEGELENGDPSKFVKWEWMPLEVGAAASFELFYPVERIIDSYLARQMEIEHLRKGRKEGSE